MKALSRMSRVDTDGYVVKWKMAGSDEVCDGMKPFTDERTAQDKADEIVENITVVVDAWVERG